MRPELLSEEKSSDNTTPANPQEHIKIVTREVHELLSYQFSIGISHGNWSFFDYRNPQSRLSSWTPFPWDKWIMLADHMETLDSHLEKLSLTFKGAKPALKHLHGIHSLRPLLESAITPTTSYSFSFHTHRTRPDANRYGIPDILHFTRHLKWHHSQSIRENVLDEKEATVVNHQSNRITKHTNRIKEHLTTLTTELNQHLHQEKQMVQAFIKEYKKQCWLGTGHGHWFFGWALPRSNFGRIFFEHPQQLTWANIEKYVSDSVKKDRLEGKDPAKRASVRTFAIISQLDWFSATDSNLPSSQPKDNNESGHSSRSPVAGAPRRP